MNNLKQSEPKEGKGIQFSFASIDQYVETYIVSPKEKLAKGKNLVEWGDNNAYPDYLLDLYNNVPTLQSIITGNRDFVTGDDVKVLPLTPLLAEGKANRKEAVIEFVRDLALSYEIYGGFAVQVVRAKDGTPAELYALDMRFVRTNKDCNVFYYCEDWGKKGAKDVVVYPAFIPGLEWSMLDEDERNRHASSVVFVKSVNFQVYPKPMYSASVKACEIERLIDDFHISDINNHFVSSAIVNFNNGDPGDQVKKQIEADFNEKFCGAKNGGRMAFSWNPDKESATDIIEFKVEDFGERYKALSEHSRRQIFTSFRAIPILFGLTAEANTGFSTDEFEQSFKLYNRTQIRPVQRMVCDTFDKIFGETEVLTIVPFSLDSDTEKNVN